MELPADEVHGFILGLPRTCLENLVESMAIILEKKPLAQWMFSETGQVRPCLFVCRSEGYSRTHQNPGLWPNFLSVIVLFQCKAFPCCFPPRIKQVPHSSCPYMIDTQLPIIEKHPHPPSNPIVASKSIHGPHKTSLPGPVTGLSSHHC